MGKITFRAENDLVDQIEAFDASKSEVMREALRAYLEERDGTTDRSDEHTDDGESLDDVIRTRIDERVEERLEELVRDGFDDGTGDVSVTIALEGSHVADGPSEPSRSTIEQSPTDQPTTDQLATDQSMAAQPPTDQRAVDQPTTQSRIDVDRWTEGHGTPGPDRRPEDAIQCRQCGSHLAREHVFCSNCGEKASRRLFCECGDEVRSDWSFCPSCGRRTPAADVLNSR